MTQTIDSARTSLKQVPALHKWATVAGHLPESTVLVADIGCGAYDVGMNYLREHGMAVVGYDPYNRPEAVNMRTRWALEAGVVDVALVANVLNVINSAEARRDVMRLAATARTAYFTVYEGDRSGRGRESTKGWQEHRRTADYMPELRSVFNHVEKRGQVLICWN